MATLLTIIIGDCDHRQVLHFHDTSLRIYLREYNRELLSIFQDIIVDNDNVDSLSSLSRSEADVLGDDLSEILRGGG